MSNPAPRPGLRERVAAAIVEAAATVLAEHGDSASMSDVAGAAGVARATLYRYFPNREALLEALGSVAVDEAGQSWICGPPTGTANRSPSWKKPTRCSQPGTPGRPRPESESPPA